MVTKVSRFGHRYRRACTRCGHRRGAHGREARAFLSQAIAANVLVDTRAPFRGVDVLDDALRVSVDPGAQPTARSRHSCTDRSYGADTLRATVLFAGPIEDDVDWADVSPNGMFKWLSRLCRLVDTLVGDVEGQPEHPGGDAGLAKATAKAVAGVTGDFDAFKYNTAIAKLVTLANGVQDAVRSGARGEDVRSAIEALLVMLSPIAPHVTEELWSRLGHSTSVHRAA